MKKILTAVSFAFIALSVTACSGKKEAAPTAAVSPVAADNLKKAESFLAENAKKPGVITTKSGLQYQITTKGDEKSKKPSFTSIVEVEYEGKFLDGSKFDATEPGKPAQFPVQDLIPAWTEVLQLMNAGEEVTLWVHPKLGYGANAFPMGCGVQEPCAIPPNSLLIFKMKLLSTEG